MYSSQELEKAKEDLDIARRFMIQSKKWHQDLESSLCFRKYGGGRQLQYSNYHEMAEDQYNITNLPFNQADKQRILLKRMICDQYELVSDHHFGQVPRKQKKRCQFCQKQIIKFIYKVRFTGGRGRAGESRNRKLYDFGEDCASLIQSLKKGERVELFNHRNLNRLRDDIQSDSGPII